jgi:RHS repeat-associated protein
MVYDAADRLIRWPGMYGSDNGTTNPDDDIAGFVYYGDGSLKEKFNAKVPVADLLTSYTYTPDGLLYKSYEGAINENNVRSTHIWDGDKNRVQLVVNGSIPAKNGTYSFVYDTTAGIPAVIEEVTPDGSVFYIREPGGELLARVDGSDIRYYHFDELGSTRMLTDGTGTVTDRYVYDAWGNALSHTGSTDQPYQYVGRLGYYTHTQDPEFALMQLGVRFYDAQVGRFTSRDPAKSAINDYIYSKDHPVMNVDPSGLFERVGCDKKGCKALDKWINEVKQKLYKNQSCRTAIDKAGIECLKFFEDNLKDMVLYCDDLSKTRETGYCRSKGAIHIDCSKAEPAGTIMHEMTHACFWDKVSKGEIPPPNQAPGHKCKKCGAQWYPGEGDPVWEGAAEDVKHACGW